MSLQSLFLSGLAETLLGGGQGCVVNGPARGARQRHDFSPRRDLPPFLS